MNITQFEYSIDAENSEHPPSSMTNTTGVAWEATFDIIRLLNT